MHYLRPPSLVIRQACVPFLPIDRVRPQDDRAPFISMGRIPDYVVRLHLATENNLCTVWLAQSVSPLGQLA